jgi:hypothetical protein
MAVVYLVKGKILLQLLISSAAITNKNPYQSSRDSGPRRREPTDMGATNLRQRSFNSSARDNSRVTQQRQLSRLRSVRHRFIHSTRYRSPHASRYCAIAISSCRYPRPPVFSAVVVAQDFASDTFYQPSSAQHRYTSRVKRSRCHESFSEVPTLSPKSGLHAPASRPSQQHACRLRTTLLLQRVDFWSRKSIHTAKHPLL